MKILMVCPFIAFGRGGLERVGTDTANAMASRGHEVTVAHMVKEGRTAPVFPLDSRVQRLGFDSPKDQRIHNSPNAATLTDCIRGLDPDVFFVQWGGYPLVYLLASALAAEVPFAYQEATNPKRMVQDNWAAPRGITYAEAQREREIVAASAVRIRQTMPSYASSLPDYIRGHVRHFPNAVPPPERVCSFEPFAESRKRILFFGGFKQVKNLPPLLLAFKSLAEDFPSWDLHVYGGRFKKETAYREKLDGLISGLGLGKRLIIHGEVAEIYPEMEKGNIHVIPSLDEGRPTVLCEAMAHGLPSIGLESCPGTNELIRYDENGLLVREDPSGQSLADGLRLLMDDAARWQRISIRCIEDATAFQPECVYDSWEGFFREIADYKTNPSRLYEEQAKIDPAASEAARRERERLISLYQRPDLGRVKKAIKTLFRAQG